MGMVWERFLEPGEVMGRNLLCGFHGVFVSAFAFVFGWAGLCMGGGR